MESYDTLLPYLVEHVELLLLPAFDSLLEVVELIVLGLIFLGLFSDLLLHQFVHFGLEFECDVDKLLAHPIEVGATALLLEHFQVVEAFSQMANLVIPLLPLHVDLLPDTINVSDLIGEQKLVTEALHKGIDLDVRTVKESFDFVFDFALLFNKIIVELLNEFLAFLEAFDMALSSAVLLRLNHIGSFIRGNHFLLKPSSFNFSLVDF